MELPGLLYAGMVFYAFFCSSDILKDKNYGLKVKKDLALKMILSATLQNKSPTTWLLTSRTTHASDLFQSGGVTSKCFFKSVSVAWHDALCALIYKGFLVPSSLQGQGGQLWHLGFRVEILIS